MNTSKKILLSLLGVLWIAYAVTNAIQLNIISSLVNNGMDFSSVNFIAPGNDFIWAIIRNTNPGSSVNMKITFNGEQIICTKEVKGLYFNSQRGKRLRPLDSGTLNILKNTPWITWYAWLSMSWWRYTDCTTGWNDTLRNKIYWAITYTRWGIKSYLVAGTKLDYFSNKIMTGFRSGDIYPIDKIVPRGYLYDSNGWIGFFWGYLTGHDKLIACLNSGKAIENILILSTTETSIIATGCSGLYVNIPIGMTKDIIIQGSVGLSTSILEGTRNWLANSLTTKTVIYNAGDINSSTLINTAKQKAQLLCKGKTSYTWLELKTTQDSIICVEGLTGLTINLASWAIYQNKTIIVRSGNVILSGGMTNTSPSLDLFVDKGIVFLPNSFEKQSFNSNWYPIWWGGSSWLYLKGNIIINGLLIAWSSTTPSTFLSKLHFQGKITLLNTPLDPTPAKTSQIENIFWTWLYDNFISLNNIFMRRCGNGTGSDSTPCKTWDIMSTTPIVILNGSYPSNLLQ